MIGQYFGKLLHNICREDAELVARALLKIPAAEREQVIHELAMVTNLTASFWKREIEKLGREGAPARETIKK